MFESLGEDKFETSMKLIFCTGQISASLTSLSRTIDDYSETAKKELIPTKQEKAHERLKTFRSDLLEYRQTFDRLKKDREDSVRTLHHPTDLPINLPSLTRTKTANDSSPHRTARAASPPYVHPRKPLRPAIPPLLVTPFLHHPTQPARILPTRLRRLPQ